MKYNAIMPRDDDSFYLWYDSLKGFRLNIIGDGNCNFNREADVLFQIERERIIKWIEENRSGIEFEPGEVIYRDHFNSESLIAFINGDNKSGD